MTTLFSAQASEHATTADTAIAMERRASVTLAAQLIVDGKPGRAQYELARSVVRQARMAGLRHPGDRAGVPVRREVPVMTAWPEVDVDEYGQMTCPVLRCDAPLYLTRTYCIPLIAEQAASGDYEPASAVSDAWHVECTNGHRLHDHIDQVRETNATGGDLDETGDSAPEYDHFLTHQRIHALGGERL